MPRGRIKRRGYHESGFKKDRYEPSMDMCPYCIAFCCDPMAMSHKFRAKVDERRRKGLCHCCGMPLAHCKCKSSEKIAPGAHVIRTHNNKKLRQAQAGIKAREELLQLWHQYTDAMLKVMPEREHADVTHALLYHQVPNVSYKAFAGYAKRAGIDPAPFQLAWTPQNA